MLVLTNICEKEILDVLKKTNREAIDVKPLWKFLRPIMKF